ncbi:MAG TPA: hypothetical protein VGL56_17405 [Fimbriimonadaceae bacterium]|jgi:hypothetical protein
MSFPSFEPEEPFIPGDEQPALFELDWEIEALSQPDSDKPWFWFPSAEEEPADADQLDLGMEDPAG